MSKCHRLKFSKKNFFFQFNWIRKFSYLYIKFGCPTLDPKLSHLNSWALMSCYLCNEPHLVQFLLIIKSINIVLLIWNNVSLHFCNKLVYFEHAFWTTILANHVVLCLWCDSICYTTFFFFEEGFTFSPRGTRNYVESNTPCWHQ